MRTAIAKKRLAALILAHKVMRKLMPNVLDIEYEVGYHDGMADAKFLSKPGTRLG
jgi:hypothetical protein